MCVHARAGCGCCRRRRRRRVAVRRWRIDLCSFPAKFISISDSLEEAVMRAYCTVH